ncbi:MAG: hypothetical protein C4340_06060, partial [Armatimonadota bacterium]
IWLQRHLHVVNFALGFLSDVAGYHQPIGTHIGDFYPEDAIRTKCINAEVSVVVRLSSGFAHDL